MTRTHWTVEAQADLAALDEQYSQLSPTYALRMGRELLAAGRFLADYPLAGPSIEYLDLRKWRVRRTNYILVYRLMPDGIENGRENWRKPTA